MISWRCPDACHFKDPKKKYSGPAGIADAGAACPIPRNRNVLHISSGSLRKRAVRWDLEALGHAIELLGVRVHDAGRSPRPVGQPLRGGGEILLEGTEVLE
eukprot:4987015-Alexandrium_andersonii.AAC.1